MKNFLLLVVALVIMQNLEAQYTLRLIVTDVATKKEDEIYVAGTFNNWNPEDPAYKLKPYGTNRKAIILKDITAGNYQFKFTRGKDKWESTAKGEDIANREITVSDDV